MCRPDVLVSEITDAELGASSRAPASDKEELADDRMRRENLQGVDVSVILGRFAIV